MALFGIEFEDSATRFVVLSEDDYETLLDRSYGTGP
jgi:hypothetical protein